MVVTRLSERTTKVPPVNLRIVRSANFIAALSFMGVSGCTASVHRPDPCTADLECRQAFGWGSTCTDEGACTEPSLESRCTMVYPEDLFEDPRRYRDAQLFGALFSYEDHAETLKAAELAFRLANQSEASPLTYGLVTCDTSPGEGLDEEASIEAGTRYLIETLHVPAIIGPRGSSRTEVAWSVAQGTNTLLITPSATSPVLTELDETAPSDENPGLLWRTVPPDTLQGLAIADDIYGRGVREIAVMYRDDSYGQALSELLSSEFQALGGNPPQLEPYDSNLADAVGSVSASSAEEIVLISPDIVDYIAFLELATASPSTTDAFDARGIFFSDGAFNARLYEDPQASAEVLFDNIRGSRPATAEGALFDTFVFEYFDEYGASPDALGFTANSYDAAWLVLYASVWSAAADGEIHGRGVAKGLRQISSGDAVEIRASTWPALVDAMNAQTSVDVRGASGQLNYDPSIEETTGPIERWTLVEDGGSWAFGQIDIFDP